MTENEYREIDEAIDKAQESVVPFPVQTEDELSVIGDANRTELNAHSFTLHFTAPNEQGKYTRYTKEYQNVFISPRHAPSINKAMTSLMPYFRKIKGDGSVASYTEAEKVQIAREMSQSQELYDIMRDLVAIVLNVDDTSKNYIDNDDVFESTIKILLQYPDMVNASDTFFG